MPTNWLNIILSHQATPPAGVWVNIANELDKENTVATNILTAKILAHEVAPPAAVLDNIFNTLDNNEALSTIGYVERIKNYSEETPAVIWNKIIAGIDAEEAKVVPISSSRKRVFPMYSSVAVAAAVIAIIVIAVLPVTQQKKVAGNIVAKVVPVIQDKPVVATLLPANDIVDNTQKIDKPAAKVINTLPKQNSSAHANDNNVPHYITGTYVADLAQNPAANNKEKLQNTKGEIPTDIALMNTPNTYISITGPDGQTVKVSSKFSNLIGYLNGSNTATQENIDIIIEESAKWRKIFSEWRDKMTNNAVAPSFLNFMDIIELSKVLEEKN